MISGERLRVAVVGTGISGMSAAWLLQQHHDVTVFERAGRIGGHSNTVDVTIDGASIPVDTGFIVYNEAAYPNLTALMDHLGVATQPSDMSFAVSLDNGGLEYSGTNLAGLFAQKRNVFRPKFWSMLNDIQRFYREAPSDIALIDQLHTTLGDYLDMRRYGQPFRDHHLLPMAGAIWSASPKTMLGYPAAAFIRFHDNHGLLQVTNRPQWRTIIGGSRAYVAKLTEDYADRITLATGAERVRRTEDGVEIRDDRGEVRLFDQVVIASHADQALTMLDDPSPEEMRLLGAFRYSRNLAVLHTDPRLMPKRRSTWSSWNYIGAPSKGDDPAEVCSVTYWMNLLQNLPTETPVLVSLNPPHHPDPRSVLREEVYEHPMFNSGAMTAQRELWQIQGQRGTWFCGSYFGSGFHEDGLQSGLAVAEALGGVRRPWQVANESGRIFLNPREAMRPEAARAAA